MRCLQYIHLRMKIVARRIIAHMAHHCWPASQSASASAGGAVKLRNLVTHHSKPFNYVQNTLKRSIGHYPYIQRDFHRRVWIRQKSHIQLISWLDKSTLSVASSAKILWYSMTKALPACRQRAMASCRSALSRDDLEPSHRWGRPGAFIIKHLTNIRVFV